MRIIDFSVFTSFEWVPGFTVVELFSDLSFFESTDIGAYIGTIAVAYIPVAFVVFAEHIADHKNISSIIGTDLLRNPGLSRTLLGDGVGSMVGRDLRRLPQHDLRRIHRLRRHFGQRFRRDDLRNGRCLPSWRPSSPPSWRFWKVSPAA